MFSRIMSGLDLRSRNGRSARIASASFTTPVLPPIATGLTVLAYHRIGNCAQTEFDPWVITADQDQLERQLRYFQKHHRIVGLEEAIAIASGRQTAPGRAILITFDDGYRDNYQQALPVLRSLGIQATFFLVTGFMAGGSLAWWDRIAWQVRSMPHACFSLPVGSELRAFDLRETSAADAISQILALYKACPREAQDDFEANLQAALPANAQPPTERLFMTTTEARELLAQGMAIGAHTLTHPILAGLSPDEQFDEMRRSRELLGELVGATIDVMAYPVGGPNDFDATTRALAAECGYRAAFSCHGGLNVPGRTDLFDIKRKAVYWDAQPEHLVER